MLKNFILCISIFLTINQIFGQNPANCSGTSAGPTLKRVLIAGDSWAQYMWDDDSHNNLFNAYGHDDKAMMSESYGTTSNIVFGEPPSNTTTYSVSGSEARQWVNTANYPYLANAIAELNASPSIKTVVLSIGGNDVLAGKSGGGWYLGMGATAEAAFFNTLVTNVRTIIDAFLAVRPDIEVLLSSYDYPNFNTTVFDCWIYACPKRVDLSDTNGNGSVDGTEHLITDQEINQMMILIEDYRIALVNSYASRVYFDNAVGLMHYYYGTDPNASSISSPTVPHPLAVNPYTEGGNPNFPSIRQNFRNFYDPIHLDFEEYEYKIKNEIDNYFFTRFRKSPNMTLFSQDANDGYINSYNNAVVETGLRLGDAGTFLADDYFSILSFNTSSLPDDASISGASIYINRSTASTFLGLESNPFEASDKRLKVDIKNGFFGSGIGLQGSDWNASASASDVGCAIGNCNEDFYAVRVDINSAYLQHISKTATTQFRLSFTNPDVGNEYINMFDGNGDSAFSPEDNPDQIVVINSDNLHQMPSAKKEKDKDKDSLDERNLLAVTPYPHRGLSKLMNTRAPFIDIWYTSSLLPLDLLTFNVREENKTALLIWQVANEKDMVSYIVERSQNGTEWFEIGSVAAINTQSKYSYQFIDKAPKDGLNYYRIRMVDQVSQSKYSPIRTLNFMEDRRQFSVYPNPFSNQFYLSFVHDTEESMNVSIFNMVGQRVFSTVIWSSNGLKIYPIEIGKDLPDGMYRLVVEGKTFRESKVLSKHK